LQEEAISPGILAASVSLAEFIARVENTRCGQDCVPSACHHLGSLDAIHAGGLAELKGVSSAFTEKAQNRFAPITSQINQRRDSGDAVEQQLENLWHGTG